MAWHLGVGIGMTLSHLHNILWTSGWILTKFSWIYNWDITKSWLDFGGLGIIFKVIAAEKLKIHSVEDICFLWKHYYYFLFFFFNLHGLEIVVAKCTCSDKGMHTVNISPDKKLIFNHKVLIFPPMKTIVITHQKPICWGTSNEYPQHVFMEK